jgi:Ca2+-binding EF-hand superfamily protein
MKKNVYLTSLALLTTTVVFSPASADDQGKGHYDHQYSEGGDYHGKRKHHRKGHFFKRLDDNKDGFISLEEHKKVVEHIFKRLDDNKDNIISKDERPKRHKNRLMMFGFTADDEPTKEAVLEKLTKHHKEADTNNDGKLTRDELQSHYKNQRFKRIDANQDGSISKEEFLNFKANKKAKK